jgi:hypothetical protein
MAKQVGGKVAASAEGCSMFTQQLEVASGAAAEIKQDLIGSDRRDMEQQLHREERFLAITMRVAR